MNFGTEKNKLNYITGVILVLDTGRQKGRKVIVTDKIQNNI